MVRINTKSIKISEGTKERLDKGRGFATYDQAIAILLDVMDTVQALNRQIGGPPKR